MKKLTPVHPGEILLEEFLRPLQLSQNRVALDVGVHALGLQADYDLDVEEDNFGDRLEQEVRVRAQA